MKDERCENCRFSKPHNDGIPANSGFMIMCRRFPAHVVRQTYSWCGEFSKLEDQP
jgi:hypothetical protein